MSGLILEIQAEALDSKSKVSDLLRKALVASKKLQKRGQVHFREGSTNLQAAIRADSDKRHDGFSRVAARWDVVWLHWSPTHGSHHQKR